MFCQQCGNEIKDNAKFCTECMHSVQEVAASLEEAPRAASNSEYVEKGKTISKGYWRFFVESIKAPTQGENAGAAGLTYASINIVLLSLFAGFGIYFELRKFSGGFSFIGADVSFKTVLTVFVYMLASCVISAIVLFGIARIVMNVNVRFKTVLGRYGALLTVPTAFSALYFLASLPGIVTLASLLQMFMLVGLQIASILTLFSFRKAARSAFDPIYALLIFYAVFGMFFWITRGFLPSMFLGFLLH